MHRSTSNRLGALGLSLLLQVFVLSGLLHPCCLGDAGGSVGAHHGSSHTQESEGHAEASAPNVHAHQTMHGASDVTPLETHDVAPIGTHDDTSSDDSSSHDCDGDCAFCCSTAGSAVLPSLSVAVAAHAVTAPSAIDSEPVSTPRSQPRFILPFANGPPTAAIRSV